MVIRKNGTAGIQHKIVQDLAGAVMKMDTVCALLLCLWILCCMKSMAMGTVCGL
jgi:hypothetical protein